MRNKIVFPLIAISIAILATAAFAQQRRGGGTPPAGPQSVISGTVASFTASPGQGMPALVLNRDSGQLTLVLGPFWFLQNAKFAAAAGDRVDATVLACTDCPSGYAVVSVSNLTNGSSVVLRNSDGLPLWQSGGRRGGRGGAHQGGRSGFGPGAGAGTCNGTGPDMTRVATHTGTVVSFSGGPGAGRPTLVLSTAGGEKTFLVAPYRAVLDAGLDFAPGASYTLTAAPNVDDEWVVVTLKDNATGAELVLRDATTGIPANGGRHGRC